MDNGLQQELRRLGAERWLDPLALAVDSTVAIPHRPQGTYTTKNDRFVLKESGFERQFAQTYFCRYHELKPHIESRVHEKWPNTQSLISYSGLDEVAICGILFKSMKLKPQVLDKYLAKRAAEKELQTNKNRIRDDDILYLEDEGTRTELTGTALPINRLVSGLCIAVKGRQLPDGRFDVADVCYPGYAPQEPMPQRDDDACVMLLSGLHLSTISIPCQTALGLLCQYLTGKLGDVEAENQNIVRVVICGGLVGKNEDLATGPPNSRRQIRSLGPIVKVDDFVARVSACIPVDVMPGLHDPSTFLLPQQALHRCLFPRASKTNQNHTVTNPHNFNIDGVEFLGTSGQPIEDILLHGEYENGLDVLQQCLEYRHVAPTCPDTLTCFPFNQSDPFVIEQTPHVFFAGNQPSFQTKLLKNFSMETKAVLVNLRTLETNSIAFDATLLSP